jgi:long-chain acyl-CoA synthetase
MTAKPVDDAVPDAPVARPDAFAWGSSIVDADVRGFPARVYEPRRHSLPELLLDARRWADREYVVQGDRRLTFRDHEHAVARSARRLRSEGVGPGARVMLAGVNSVEWVIALWSLLTAGACVALANFWWSHTELAGAIEDLRPSLVVVDPTRLAELPSGVASVDVGEFTPVTANVGDDVLDLPAVEEDDPALVIFTSGSTGRPKGAVLSHHGVIAAQQNLLASTGRLPHQLADDHPAIVSMLTAPLFHLGGVGPLITALVVGGEVVFLERRFDAGEVLDLIERERVTVWNGVPTTMQRILAEPDLGARDTSSLRTVGLGGAPVPPDLPERIRAAFPTVRRGVSEVYGMTETSGFVATASGKEVLDRPGTTGRVVPVVDARIVEPDEDGVGEIAVRGPTVMLGYLGDDGVALDDEGFFRTGDLGRFDDDGYLYITGRSKDVIIRGGENIAARHVEERLAQHHGVREVAVVGLPHEDLGEEVGAVVVLAGDGASPAELADFARDELAYFEVPTRWWLRAADLPTTPFGKPDKVQLRANFPSDDEDGGATT